MYKSKETAFTSRHFHTRWQLSETSWQVHLPRKQCFINRKRHGQLPIGYWSYGSQTWPIKWNAVSSNQRSRRYGLHGRWLSDWKKKLDGNYTRMLRTILNKSWRQHPTKQPLYSHLPSIIKTIKVRRTRHAGHCWRSSDELISDVLL